jgi:nicotinamide mononucleotide (NMN) deamidase PncC
VGLVYYHVETPEGGHGASFDFPGDRDSIRRRAAVASLHILLRLLTQSRHASV